MENAIIRDKNYLLELEERKIRENQYYEHQNYLSSLPEQLKNIFKSIHTFNKVEQQTLNMNITELSKIIKRKQIEFNMNYRKQLTNNITNEEK